MVNKNNSLISEVKYNPFKIDKFTLLGKISNNGWLTGSKSKKKGIKINDPTTKISPKRIILYRSPNDKNRMTRTSSTKNKLVDDILKKACPNIMLVILIIILVLIIPVINIVILNKILFSISCLKLLGLYKNVKIHKGIIVIRGIIQADC